jgi:hypothetical protein
MTRFTRRWTGKLASNWQTYCAPLFPAGRPPITWLEIGVYEGQTAKWVLDNVLTEPGDLYVGIDPWELEAMDPHKWPRDGRGQEQIGAVEETAYRTLDPYLGKHCDVRAYLIKGRSVEVLRDQTCWLCGSDNFFDVAYIDGLHTPLGILSDAVLVWPLVKIGGVIIFDDYTVRRRHTRRQIQRTINDFLQAIAGSYKELFRNSQLGIQKLDEGYQCKWRPKPSTFAPAA